jgi:hypothetical protein
MSGHYLSPERYDLVYADVTAEGATPREGDMLLWTAWKD